MKSVSREDFHEKIEDFPINFPNPPIENFHSRNILCTERAGIKENTVWGKENLEVFCSISIHDLAKPKRIYTIFALSLKGVK